MNIALIGYGKMGKAIEKIALEKGYHIIARVEKDHWDEFNKLEAKDIDVAIEFSQPQAAFDNILKCIKLGIPVISGTTGWLDKQQEIEQWCEKLNGTFFYASNFSVGVNIFFKINELVAKMMDKFPAYKVQMEEVHHVHKKDAPSGTAITLAEGIVENCNTINRWVATDSPATTGQGELAIKSLREGEVPGTHTVQYTSDMDMISLVHKASSREGFAMGAVLVAAWVIDKKGVLGMKNFMEL